MNDEAARIFEQARELPSEARDAFVTEACEGDAALRDELLSLLKHADAGESFFESLAHDVFSPDATSRVDAMVGRTIGRYTVEAHVASGGMGAVYRAFDSQLKRRVALKFLPVYTHGDGEAEARLLEEARAAASLEHPNVCTIHEIGESEDGRPFIAMALYEGETLKQRLARGAIPLDETMAIVMQITSALAAAHARGIVHRDVKPGNVMLASDGTVRLLDFGLARMQDAVFTPAGMTLGTIAYMSPEQITGGVVDQRTDLWSLGVVFFEMITGVRPFRGSSDRAVMQAIVHGDVASLTDRQPEVPGRIADIVARLIRKHPDDRYASAHAVMTDLEGAFPVGDSRRHVRTRLRDRRVVAVVIGAMLAAGLAFSFWPRPNDEKNVMALRSARRPIERILVADFANFTADSLLADAVSQALRIDLARASGLRVAGSTLVTSALSRMRRPADTRLTSELAREVAVREGIPAVIEGDVREAGRGYVLSVAIIEAGSGRLIDGSRATAGDAAGVIAAIDSLSTSLRTHLGERLTSFTPSEPLAHSTTASLAALRIFARAQLLFHRGNMMASAALFEEAIRIDSAFAHAHLFLAIALTNAGVGRGRAVRAIANAYALRERLSSPERYAITAGYFEQVVGDMPKALEAYRNQVEAAKIAGGDFYMYSSLGRLLASTDNFSEAESALEESWSVWPTGPAQANLVRVLYRQGKTARALEVLRTARTNYPSHPGLLTTQAELLMLSQDHVGADSTAALVVAGSGIGYAERIKALNAALEGRMADAIAYFRAMREQQLSARLFGLAINTTVAIGRLQLLSNKKAVATGEVEQHLRSHPLDSLDAFDRPYLLLSRFFAEAGRPDRALEMLNSYEREVPHDRQGPDRWVYLRARAAVRLAEGKPRDALVELERAAQEARFIDAAAFDDYLIPLGERPELARAYDLAGLADSAIVVYEHYLAARSIGRVSIDAFELPDALFRLAELYEARGDNVAAARTYLQFAQRWRGADSSLQPRVQLAKERAGARSRIQR